MSEEPDSNQIPKEEIDELTDAIDDGKDKRDKKKHRHHSERSDPRLKESESVSISERKKHHHKHSKKELSESTGNNDKKKKRHDKFSIQEDSKKENDNDDSMDQSRIDPLNENVETNNINKLNSEEDISALLQSDQNQESPKNSPESNKQDGKQEISLNEQNPNTTDNAKNTNNTNNNNDNNDNNNDNNSPNNKDIPEDISALLGDSDSNLKNQNINDSSLSDNENGGEIQLSSKEEKENNAFSSDELNDNTNKTRTDELIDIINKGINKDNSNLNIILDENQFSKQKKKENSKVKFLPQEEKHWETVENDGIIPYEKRVINVLPMIDLPQIHNSELFEMLNRKYSVSNSVNKIRGNHVKIQNN